MSTATDQARQVTGSGRAPRTDVPRRTVVSTGLLGIALIHLLDLPRKFHEAPYLAVAYLGVILACALLAETLLYRADHRIWRACALLAGAVMFGYAVSRTVGLPGTGRDVGNWLAPLGLASLFVEGTVILLAVGALTRRDR